MSQTLVQHENDYGLLSHERAASRVRLHTGPILLLALAARLAAVLIFYGFASIPPLTSWGVEMIATALSIHNGHGFSSPFISDSGPTAFSPPGSVLLIAAVMRFFGTGSLAATAIVLLQVGFSVMTVWLVMFTARRHFGDRAANFAGLICAIFPSFVVAPVKIGDAAVSALLVALVFAGASTLQAARWRFIPAGAICAIAGLMNPVLIPTMWALCAWAAWKVKQFPWMGILAFLIVFSPWPIRNAVVMHAFVPLRSNFGYELYMGNHAGGNGDFPQAMNPMMDENERRAFLREGEMNYMSEKGAIARNYIASHKSRFALLTLRRVGQFWAGAEDGEGPTTIPLLVLSLGGFAMLWRRKELSVLYALPLILFPLPYYITHVSMRFQYPIDPMLAILGASALSALLVGREARRRNPVPSGRGALGRARLHPAPVELLTTWAGRQSRGRSTRSR